MTSETDITASPGLDATVEAIRQSFADPMFATRPDLQAAAETRIAVARLRSGTAEPVVTPQTLAEAAHAAAFATAMPAGLADLLEQRTADVAALGDAAMRDRATALRAKLGPRYDDLMREAAGAGEMSSAVGSDEFLLLSRAAWGRHALARAATAPRSKP